METNITELLDTQKNACKNMLYSMSASTAVIQETKMRRGKQTSLSLEEAASIFGIPLETLKEETKLNRGVMPIIAASRLLNINADTLYAAAGRYTKFPNAVSRPAGKNTGVKQIDIFHKEFIEWRKVHPNKYQSPEEKEPHLCKINELFLPPGSRIDEQNPRELLAYLKSLPPDTIYKYKDERGEERIFTYVDEDGNVEYIRPCFEIVPRADHKFHDFQHSTLYRQARNEFSQMGKIARKIEGKPSGKGKSKSSASSSTKRSNAAAISRLGKLPNNKQDQTQRRKRTHIRKQNQEKEEPEPELLAV